MSQKSLDESRRPLTLTPHMKTNMTPIEGASRYAMSETTGNVYRIRGSKLIKKQYSPTGVFWVITDDNNNRVRIERGQKKVRLTKPCTLQHESLKQIPDYPDYAITPYGAVWRVSGGRLREPVLLSEHDRGSKRYVKLMNKFGKRHNRNVEWLLERTWGERLDN